MTGAGPMADDTTPTVPISYVKQMVEAHHMQIEHLLKLIEFCQGRTRRTCRPNGSDDNR